MYRLGRERSVYVILVGILITALVIIFGYYGFSNFLKGIEDNEVVPLLLVIIVVGIMLVILQRAGIIFADRQL
jgi:hypothetical protein